MSGISKTITINASIEDAYKVISDFEKYPEFLSEMEDVTIEKRGSKEIIASFTVNIYKTVTYRLKFKLNEPTGVSWDMLEGELLSHNSGSWKLKRLSPKKTEAKYSIDVKFGSFVPGFISNALMENTLPHMLDNFKDRIEGLKD